MKKIKKIHAGMETIIRCYINDKSFKKAIDDAIMR